MQLAICWSGSSDLPKRRQKSNCSNHIATKFLGVLFGVIHTIHIISCDHRKCQIGAGVQGYINKSFEWVTIADSDQFKRLINVPSGTPALV